MISDEILSQEAKVQLIGITRYPTSEYPFGPDDFSSFGAQGCFDELSSIELLKNKFEEDKYKRSSGEGSAFYMNTINEVVLKESSGRGHGSVADQNYFIFSIENLTRAATLQLCLPEYLSHLQQSLRRAKADRGFYIPESIRESKYFEDTKQILYDSFKSYEEMSVNEIPGEDARFHLPLATKTNIQTGGDARELTHLHGMNDQGEVPSYVKNVVNEMIDKASQVAPKLFKRRDTNYEVLAWYPSAQLYSSENFVLNKLIEKYDKPNKVILLSYSGIDEIDEDCINRAVKDRNETDLANLKHIHFEFLVPMSITCYHQSTRQRTWGHSIESIYNTAQRRHFVIPPTIESSNYKEEYIDRNERMMDLYNELIAEGIKRKEAIGVVPHSLKMYDWIHVNGWNALHSISKRTCKEAQWEIRNIARQMSEYIKEKNPALGKWAEPQCITYRRCPERKPCGYEENIHKFWN